MNSPFRSRNIKAQPIHYNINAPTHRNPQSQLSCCKRFGRDDAAILQGRIPQGQAGPGMAAKALKPRRLFGAECASDGVLKRIDVKRLLHELHRTTGQQLLNPFIF